jgi:hypothetical protein
MQTLYFSPGERATIFLDSFDSDSIRADGYDLPVVSRIIFPDLSLATGFPTNMTKLDTGLYYFRFTLPLTASAVGSYLVDVTYWDPTGTVERQTLYHIIVTAPFGNFSVSPG